MKLYTQIDWCWFVTFFESILHMFQRAGCGGKIKYSHHFWVRETSRQTRGVILKHDEKKKKITPHGLCDSEVWKQTCWEMFLLASHWREKVPPGVRSLSGRWGQGSRRLFCQFTTRCFRRKKKRQKQEWEPWFKGAKQLINQMVSHF